ncbi:hypothetical protein GGF46_000660 [Coemansia sp. RSA 552]|nr:hypothetical protein GGF46_000660 [Coemansia sp. RSA 552]
MNNSNYAGFTGGAAPQGMWQQQPHPAYNPQNLQQYPQPQAAQQPPPQFPQQHMQHCPQAQPGYENYGQASYATVGPAQGSFGGQPEGYFQEPSHHGNMQYGAHQGFNPMQNQQMQAYYGDNYGDMGYGPEDDGERGMNLFTKQAIDAYGTQYDKFSKANTAITVGGVLISGYALKKMWEHWKEKREGSDANGTVPPPANNGAGGEGYYSGSAYAGTSTNPYGDYKQYPPL